MPEDVSNELRVALDQAPDDERALLELRLTWPRLDDAAARVAARLRVFLLTWDPLSWHDRPPGRATATGDGDDCEVVLYLQLDEILAAVATSGERLAGVLGSVAASVLSVGARCEQALVAGIHPQLAFEDKAPGLLSEVGQLAAFDTPDVSLVSEGWEPIGLGAIQDVVQAAFGPVDLDRAAVRLAAAAEPVADCPACDGRRLGFPGELTDAQPQMCAPHSEQAQAVAEERFERGWESNRKGMDAILRTSSLLFEPTYGLTLSLLRRLEDVARRDVEDSLSPAFAAADAELALAVAERLRDDPEQLRELLSSDRLPADWLMDLPLALASSGLLDEAVRVADAFAPVADHAPTLSRDVAFALAQAGRGDEALRSVEDDLRRLPGDPWSHIRAGDVYQALGDAGRAEDAFRTALTIARRGGDPEDVLTVLERLGALLADQPGREREASAVQRESRRALSAAYGGGPRIVAPKVGRNDPCPCGSGRKHKRCCGA